MGEYAIRKSDNEGVKIGTCERMYYLRYDQRHLVSRVPNSLDPATTNNLYWRLPFKDEDKLEPGEFDNHSRGLRLYTKDDIFAEDIVRELGGTGIMQMHNESGLLLNIPCHHGAKLPDVGEAQAHWNGRSWFLELVAVKNVDTGFRPVAQCRFCRQMWSFDWDEIESYIEPEMLERIKAYK